MALRDTFTYGDVHSNDFGVYVLDAKLNNSTEHEYETVSIAGRDGDLHIDKKRFKNIAVPYICGIVSDAGDQMNALIAALFAEGADVRLSDTIYPEYFRKATFMGGVEPRISRTRELSVFTLEFDCAPQKWLVEGEEPIAIESGSDEPISNPTLYIAKPLIKVTGTGTLTIGDATIEIVQNSGDMAIDCDLEDAYDTVTMENLNGDIILASGKFPVLGVGETGVVMSSGLSIEIIPRWWTV